MPRICRRCILPGEYKTIGFDASGVCSYCRQYDRAADLVAQRGPQSDWPGTKLATRPQGTKYDCLVGLSGGRDSAYVLWRLRKRHGLNVLVFTLDNGFLTGPARRNIGALVSEMEIDHVWCDEHWALLREAYRRALSRFAYPCMVCSYALLGLFLRLGIAHGIPLAVHGRSRAEMLKEYCPNSGDPLAPFLALTFLPYDRDLTVAAWTACRRRVAFLLRHALGSRAMTLRFMSTFFGSQDELEAADVVPEFFGLLASGAPRAGGMAQMLCEETSWIAPDSYDPAAHYDCSIYPATELFSMDVVGYSRSCPELAFRVREGSLTRDEALRLLPHRETVREQAAGSIDTLCSALGIARPQLTRMLCRARLRHAVARPMLRLAACVSGPRFGSDGGIGPPG